MNELLLQDDASSEISFALPQEVLAKVLFEFLGKKEKLSFEKVANYCLKLNDIKQFYHLLRNKIDKEKTTEVEFFQATIFYDDDTNRTFDTYEQVEEFHEVKSVTPRFFIMNWHIIVNFPNSETIETQKIELVYGVTDNKDGYVTCIINHTNHIWATEVQNLFVNQIEKTLVSNNNKVELLARFTYGYKSIVTSMSLFAFLIIVIAVSILNKMPLDKPNYYEELVKRNITIIDKSEVKEVLLLSNASENKKLLGLSILDQYEGKTLLELLKNNVKSNKILTKAQKYVENRKEINLVIMELDKKNGNHKSLLSRIYSYFILFIICMWLLYFILFLFNKQYQKFYRTKPFILVTDLAKKKHEDFLESKNKAVLYGGSAMVFAVISSLIAALIWWVLSKGI